MRATTGTHCPRLRAGLPVLLVVLISWPLAGGGAAEGEPAPQFAKKALLKPAKRSYTFHYRYDLPDGVAPVTTPGLRAGKLARRGLYFVDVNGNGSFNDPGIDGWALVKGAKRSTDRFVFPLRDRVVFDGRVITYRVQADGSRVDYDATPIKAPADILAGLRKLNELRMQSGLLPVTFDREYSEKAAKHVRYMLLNDAYGHEEIKGERGYSEDGAWAGIYSVIDNGVTLEQAVERWWATLYHRRPLADPRVVAVGAAVGKPYAMLVPRVARDMAGCHWPVLVPAPGSRGIATHAGRENPLPFPKDAEPGYPITVQFPDFDEDVTGARVSLFVATKRGREKEVLAFFSSTEAPAHASRPGNDGCLCLFSKLPLRPKTTYLVRVRCMWKGAPLVEEWTFTTGAERLPPGR